MATFAEFLSTTAGMRGYMTAALTDEYIVDTYPETINTLEGKEDKILEVRVFNKGREVRLFRPDISGEFCIRVIDDPDGTAESFDEFQYLDIDSTIDAGGSARVQTGGGKFDLPVRSGDPKIRIRYYLGKYENTGHVRITDWRLVDIVEGSVEE